MYFQNCNMHITNKKAKVSFKSVKTVLQNMKEGLKEKVDTRVKETKGPNVCAFAGKIVL